MMYVLIGVVYALGAVGSWVCMVGWEYAYVQRKFPLIAKQDEQKDWRDACIFSALTCAVWPVMLPITYFLLSKRARYGWLWRAKDGS